MRMDAHRQTTLVRRAGFSLAEVMMAIAIASFALLALLAVLPEGLNSLQDAQKQAAEARIVQQIGAQFQALPWGDLPQAVTGAGTEMIFDADGVQLEQGASSNRVFFRVRLTLLAGLPLPNDTSASLFLRRLRLQIAARGDPPPGNSTTANNRHTERYLTLVNLDKADPPAPASGPSSSGGGTSSPTATPNP